MFYMLLRMSLITLGMSVMTILLWMISGRKELTFGRKLIIGLLYGLAACAGTHFGVDYHSTMLNVRDIAPLSAGLFFGPMPGIIAGLFGGIERYIAGTYFGVGSFTRIACSSATILAGFLAAAFNRFLFHGKNPTPAYATALGIVTEVFHMFSVFITHRDDMEFALFVVDTCAIPMIIFTGLGMLISSLAIWMISNGIRELRMPKKEEISISTRFQSWLLMFVIAMIMTTYMFSQTLQSRAILQNTQRTMTQAINDTRYSILAMEKNTNTANDLLKQQGLDTARAVAREFTQRGGLSAAANINYKELCNTYRIYEIDIVDSSRKVVYSSNPNSIGYDMTSSEQSRVFLPILDGTMAEYAQDFMTTGNVNTLSLMYVGVAADGCLVQIAYDGSRVAEYLSIADISSIIKAAHFGKNGNVYIADKFDKIIAGEHAGKDAAALGYSAENKNKFYRADIFGTPSYCRFEEFDGYRIFAVVPDEELLKTLKITAYETAFADILLFALIFMLIYILVKKLIVKNINRINGSLKEITSGNLNEIIDVKSSKEFATLSSDINMTVDTLKHYIAEAENRIQTELEFARSIQASALPRVFTFQNVTEFEVFATMDPAKVVGGDFYDLFFAGPNKFALVIADVSGKGIPASLFMMRSKTTIKSLAESGKSPAEILERANNELCRGNDANMFVTAWIGIVDLETGIVRCANAGHEYPAIMRAESGEYELLKDKHGLALAAMEDMRYTEYELQLQNGDKLFVYTDGVPEATDINEEQFGTERMLSALDHVRSLPMKQVLPFMKESIDNFTGEAEQFDDITMLGFQFNHKSEK